MLEAIIELVGGLLEQRRALIRSPLTLAVGVIDLGTFVCDSGTTPLARRGWIDGAQLTILTNAKTLTDMMMGKFDWRRAHPTDLFLWEGNDEALDRVVRLLSGRSMLDVRADHRARPGLRRYIE